MQGSTLLGSRIDTGVEQSKRIDFQAWHLPVKLMIIPHTTI